MTGSLPTALAAVAAVAAADTLLGLAGADERLLGIIADAAPFDERESGVYFNAVRVGGRRRLAERSQRWLRSATDDDDVTRRALLQHRQRTGRDLGAGLVDVAVKDPARLPDWAYALIDFLLAQPPTAESDTATELVGGVFVAFHRAAVRLIGLSSADGAQVRGVAIAAEATDDIAGQLVQRLIAVCRAAIAFEIQIADGAARAVDWYGRAGIDVSRQGWLTRLQSLPGLAYLIGVTCLQYKRAVYEVFDRLQEDLPTLRRELWQWADPGRLTAYSGDSGDLHDGGRSVSLLTFSGGQRVVYKPRDLSSVAGFMDVLTFLNQHGLPLPLSTRRVLLRDGYGWEEFVEARPCDGDERPERFYRRLGMLSRLAELLECRDLWADNLVAVGDSPEFIDLENVLQGRLRKPMALGGRAEALWHQVEESVAKTATISYPRIGVAGRRAHDIGCFAPIQEQLAIDHDGFPADWEPPPYRPVVDGQAVDPVGYGDDVLHGYQEMDACLILNAFGLSTERGPLHLLTNARVRYIWRSTFDYQTVLQLSTGPLALTDGVAREMVLARLFRGARELLHADPHRADALELIEQEIEALRRLDVPMFQSEPGSSAVRTPAGATIDDHFAGTAWARLRVRLAELVRRADTDHASGIDVVATCLDFASSHTGADRSLPVPPTAPQPRARLTYHPRDLRHEVSHADLLATACAAAEHIIDAATTLEDGRYGWIGVVHYPAYGLDQVEPLHGDLLTGTAGLAVFLAELYQTTGKPAYWTFAQEALSATVEFASVAGRAAAYQRMCGGRMAVGGFVGIGAAIYALTRCGQVIGDPTLVDEAHRLVRPAADLLAAGPSYADPVLGRAGLLAALVTLRAARSAPDIDELADRLAEGLRPELHDGLAAHYPSGIALLDVLPTGAAGVRMVLDRYDGQETSPVPEPAARPDAAAMTSAALLDRIETGLTGFRSTQDEQFRDAAHAAAQTLLTRRSHTGRWFPDRRRADRLQLSAVDGVAGVGLACLALAEEDVTSLRLMS